MNTLPELRDLRYFLAVAEELHFGRAARKLNIAQPSLSVTISRLEQRLGVSLFDRTTRQVKLTAVGKQFAERCRYAVAQVEDAMSSTRLLAEGLMGQIRVSFTPTAMYRLLPSILARFHTMYPNIGISVHYKETGGQIQDLIEGRVDVGFLRLPIHTRRLTTLALAREKLLLAIPRGHPLLSRHKRIRIEHLAGADMIIYSPIVGVDWQEYVLGYCQRAGFQPRIVFQAAETYSILCLVAAGFGVSILPEWVSKSGHPGIVFQKLNEIPPIVDLGLAWVADNRSHALQSFRDVATSFAS